MILIRARTVDNVKNWAKLLGLAGTVAEHIKNPWTIIGGRIVSNGSEAVQTAADAYLEAIKQRIDAMSRPVPSPQFGGSGR